MLYKKDYRKVREKKKLPAPDAFFQCEKQTGCQVQSNTGTITDEEGGAEDPRYPADQQKEDEKWRDELTYCGRFFQFEVDQWFEIAILVVHPA